MKNLFGTMSLMIMSHFITGLLIKEHANKSGAVLKMSRLSLNKTNSTENIIAKDPVQKMVILNCVVHLHHTTELEIKQLIRLILVNTVLIE